MNKEIHTTKWRTVHTTSHVQYLHWNTTKWKTVHTLHMSNTYIGTLQNGRQFTHFTCPILTLEHYKMEDSSHNLTCAILTLEHYKMEDSSHTSHVQYLHWNTTKWKTVHTLHMSNTYIGTLQNGGQLTQPHIQYSHWNTTKWRTVHNLTYAILTLEHNKNKQINKDKHTHTNIPVSSSASQPRRTYVGLQIPNTKVL